MLHLRIYLPAKMLKLSLNLLLLVTLVLASSAQEFNYEDGTEEMTAEERIRFVQGLDLGDEVGVETQQQGRGRERRGTVGSFKEHET